MNKALFLAALLYITGISASAQNSIGIGTQNPNSSAMLDISSTNKGLLIPRMTTAQRNAIVSPATGLMVFDNETNSFWYYDGNSWSSMAGGGTLSLPYQQNINSNTAAFDITNEATAAAIQGRSTSEYGIGIKASTTGVGGWGLNAVANRSGAIAVTAFSDSGVVFDGSNQSTSNTLPAMKLYNYGQGNTAIFQTINSTNTAPSLQVATNGLGNGINVYLTNAGNGAKGMEINQSGVGPGLVATSRGSIGISGITNSLGAVGLFGENTAYGEAVYGKCKGGTGVGAVVGRNDSSGYGVRGFNTQNGIGVLGQAGSSGGTGIGGRFENINAANSNDALQAATNGTGWAANITSTNNTSSTKGLRVATTNNQGGNALAIANGTFTTSLQVPYLSNTIIDDPVLVISTAGTVTIPTGPPLTNGAHVWVVNNSGGVVNISNTTAGVLSVASGKLQHLLFILQVSGANWVPAQ